MIDPHQNIFSYYQGACLAATLIAMQSQGVDLQDIPPLHLGIFFGGFRVCQGSNTMSMNM